ncbi:GNAT family N-acetyltransferase [Streptomyces olivaceus]|uniref:GNAT family N-acetyltransferase n=1 Tax=Streptomyces olivaceus TaxID=47716 RepID=UPI001CCE1AA4|nr:GNAT family N-acetyltransferase [Streptomyces olivaceus]MBZ6204725.1 GNAT family N-acetyltransferase [Streptomyces olivaceus]MBZ6288983.1 GNAT family N-acetyltransferase [Streptomyces olivaceus]
MTTTAVELRRFGHEDLPAIRPTLLAVHADAYADEMDDEFNQRFPWFVDHWGGHPGFACVIGYDGDEPVGFAYGAPATPGREWWREHLSEPPTDDSTFSVSELMVRPHWRKTGTAKHLHETLLEDRPESLAVLLVDPGHPKVEALYEAWGYRRIGNRQPFPDSPNFTVMLRDLRVPAAT